MKDYNLQKYYWQATTLPVVYTIIIGIVLSVTHDSSKYRSEWFVDDGFVETCFLTIGLSLFIAAINTTLFLGGVSAIRQNLLLSIVCLIGPSVGITLLVILQELENFHVLSEYEGSRILDGYVLSVAVVHLIFVILAFIRLNKSVD